MPRKSAKKSKSKPKSKPKSKSKKSRRGRKPKNQQEELKLNISPKVMKSIGAIVFYLLAIMILLSFTQQGELLQALYRMTTILFAWGVIFLPFLFISAGSMLIKPNWRISRPTLLFGSIILFISSVSLTKAGSIGSEFWASIAALISGLGSAFAFLSGILIGIMVIFEISISEMLSIVGKLFKSLGRLFIRQEPDMQDLLEQEDQDFTKIDWEKKLEAKKKKEDQTEEIETPRPEMAEPKTASTKTESKEKLDLSSSMINAQDTERPWQYPPISLLSPIKGGDANRGDVKQNAQKIEDTLASFGVNAKVVDVNPGPSVTQYAIRLAIGTKLTKITSLSNDLALALAAKTGQIRIEAPIPGKSLVGIELPNLRPSLVALREMIKSKDMVKGNKSRLMVGLGLDVSGQPLVVDIAKMPHMLVAGATGSGKSVYINTLLMSLLYRNTPSEVKLILVDPKRVELSSYNGIPHLLTPVLVDPEQVVSALKWVVVEMEHRYKLLAEAGVRDIASYNNMAGFTAMPYIVVVIDELADIMLFAPSEVEDCITKIAQKARAAGIHLILATQRPSVDVITGLIKANIPTRVAFAVSSMTDSRVVLDMPGAEKLLGKGDMLYIPPDQAKPNRIQGAFVTDSDIKNVTAFIKNNGSPVQYTDEVTTKFKGSTIKGGKIKAVGDEDVDDMYEEAIKTVCSYDKASASLLQRRLSIGYNRAARILDQLHAAGIIGASQGSKPRDVLIKSYDEYVANKKSAE